MAIKEQDKVFYEELPNGDKVINLPVTRANNVEGLGRSANTNYSVGNVVYVDSNLSVALKCTQAGTTSNSELDVSGNNVGDSVTDGSVAWQVMARDTLNSLPLSGGVMSGNVWFDNGSAISRTNNNECITLDINSANGAALHLRSKDSNIMAGSFALTTMQSDGTNTPQLVGQPNKRLTWDNKEVLTVVHTNFSDNGYKVYSDGFIDQWGRVTFNEIFPANTTIYRSVTLPLTMSTRGYVVNYNILSSDSGWSYLGMLCIPYPDRLEFAFYANGTDVKNVQIEYRVIGN